VGCPGCAKCAKHHGYIFHLSAGRPTKAHEYLFLLTKNARYYWDADAVREPVAEASVARAEYRGANGTKWSDAAGYGDNEAEFGVKRRACLEHGPANNPLGRNLRSVWTIATQPYPEAHFATFPEKLVEPCVLAGSKPGDLVIDPFAGSGTVGVVARRFLRRFVGIELNTAYLGLARKRLTNVQQSMMAL
jgi:site-specific DNA-methyltransferase (cytosine-N4-specific)